MMVNKMRILLNALVSSTMLDGLLDTILSFLQSFYTFQLNPNSHQFYLVQRSNIVTIIFGSLQQESYQTSAMEQFTENLLKLNMTLS